MPDERRQTPEHGHFRQGERAPLVEAGAILRDPRRDVAVAGGVWPSTQPPGEADVTAIACPSRSGNVEERTARKSYRTRDRGKADVFNYIEHFHDARRRHPALGHLSPMEFERWEALA